MTAPGTSRHPRPAPLSHGDRSTTGAALAMAAEPAVSGDDLALFETLMGQAERFLGGEGDSPGQRRAGAALALAHASRQVRDLVASAVGPGTPVAFTILRHRDGEQVACDHYLKLPNPLSLLIVGGPAYAKGDDITVVIQRAGLPTLRRSASWPFDLTTAELLTRPDDLTTPPPGQTDHPATR